MTPIRNPFGRAALCVALSSLVAPSAAGQDAPVEAAAQPAKLAPHAAARRAVEWIGRQAVAVKGTEDAVMFREASGSSAPPAAQVYGGTAGVLLFLENAAAVLGSTEAAALADRTAAGLRASVDEDEHGPTWSPAQRDGAASLYVGDSGIAHAFLVRGRLRKSQEAIDFATQVGDALLARADRFEGQLCWDDQVEIIYGAAGTALFLLDLAEETGHERFRAAALQAGKWLIAESTLTEGEPQRRNWRWQLGGNTPYVGFSHGTAGVAYALLRIGVACEDEACVAAAKDGAAWLHAQSVREERLLRWPVVPGAPTSLGGWCHGAPGTARLLLALHAHSGEQHYLDDAVASARWVMAQAGPEDAEEPPKFPPSFCCGVAGAIDFFCDLHRVTGEEEFAKFARRAGGYLIDLGEADGEGLKWPNGRNAHRKKASSCNVDLMLGAAGNAFVLLRLGCLGKDEDPVLSLPDRRIRP